MRAELVRGLNDDNEQVRAKAFKLARRLNTDEVEKIFLERADSMKGEVAAGAIKCLGSLRPRRRSTNRVSDEHREGQRTVGRLLPDSRPDRNPRGIDLLERCSQFRVSCPEERNTSRPFVWRPPLLFLSSMILVPLTFWSNVPAIGIPRSGRWRPP